MSEHERFHIRSLAQLADEARRVGVEIPVGESINSLLTPVRVGELTAPNRIAVLPMEGFDSEPNGAPGTLSFRRYDRYARGGSGLIWFEATAVLHEARSNPGQLVLTDETVEVFKQLVAKTRQAAAETFGPGHKPVMILQMTHSGRYSKPTGKRAPIIAHHSSMLDPLVGVDENYPLVTDEYLDKLQETFVHAAELATAAGFDGVDIKSCHRYLLAELHASFTRENSRYGGTFENRTRMIRETAAKIAARVPGVFVTTRMNAYDAIPYPWGWGVDKNDATKADLTEPLQLIDALRENGAPVLALSIGNPYYEAHYGRPYDFPTKGAPTPAEHPLQGVARFVDIVRQVQQANADLPIITGGLSWLRQWIPNVAAEIVNRGWATFVGLGRSSFAYPDAAKDLMETGAMDPAKCCVACSCCTQIMRDGGRTGCVIRDSEIYGPEYRKARRFAADTLAEEAARCRNCESATCTAKCPAGVDVPGFIAAYADGDIPKAYQILKDSNYLPEMCAYICPSEVQCEGGCIEKILTNNAVRIRDLQLEVSRRAREMGLTKLILGEATGHRVAVIGAGPAGLACAARLLEFGHTVELFDRATVPGGTPIEIIPAMRLTGEAGAGEIAALFDDARQADRLYTHFGEGLTGERTLEAFGEYDAVFLGIGLGCAAGLPGARRPASGVVGALAFLKDVKRGVLTRMPDAVAVLGGGNTAMDAANAARRLGARDVYIIYRRSFAEMPAWPAERDEAVAAGVHFVILTQPLDYVVTDGRLTGLRVCRTVLGEPDESDRRRPESVTGSESTIAVEMVIEALGQRAIEGIEQLLPGVDLDKNGRVLVSDAMGTSRPGVWAGGDAVNGGATAVAAIREGMVAATGMDQFLRRA